MLEESHVIVVDIGKTLSKVSLWARDGRMLDRQSRPNRSVTVDHIARLDEEGIRRWLPKALARYAGLGISAIVPVAHGAGVAALRDGALSFPPFDYEAAAPEDIRLGYRAMRDAFAETGSPSLPNGLNLGLQLHWAERVGLYDPSSATLMPWANYWSWFLSGTASSEVSSLGCHTDLWLPEAADYSHMACNAGWAGSFAPLRHASEIAGCLRRELADETGLSADTPVLTGLHDSNAALLAARGFADIADDECTVLSTGTWFIAMRMAKGNHAVAALPEGRDCLVNVDVHGRPVPSARFMGGREIESVIEIDTRRVDIRPDQPDLVRAVPKILAARTMLLPTLTPGCGPFPNEAARWIGRPDDWIERRAAACLYAALVADRSLDLIGAKDRILVEGRFAEAEVIVRALATLRPDTQIFVANAHHDVALGALRLFDPDVRPAAELRRVERLPHDLHGYREAWLNTLQGAA